MDANYPGFKHTDNELCNFLAHLNSSCTLLKANNATNCTFKITGKLFSNDEINAINSINPASKIRDRIQAIYRSGASLELHDFDNQTFKNNLLLIDSLLPEILSNVIIEFYKSGIVTLSNISSQLVALNPLRYNQSLNHPFYKHKLKRFLSALALGMVPYTTWTGVYNGTIGYRVVKEGGEVIFNPIMNRNLFEDYLFENTKMEIPSSTRHGFGELFLKGNDLFIKLNLQIRFI